MFQQTDQADARVDSRPAGVQLRARRSPALVALGILLVVLGGLGSAALFSLNGEQHGVVTVAADIRRGDTVAREDLTVVDVPGTLAVEAADAALLDTMVGQHALTDLPKGSFPRPEHLGADPLPDGEALVGLRLPLGRLPTADMPPGTGVLLVSLADGAQWDTAAQVAARPVLLDDGASYSVNVRVPDPDALEVARLSAADQLALVVVSEDA